MQNEQLLARCAQGCGTDDEIKRLFVLLDSARELAIDLELDDYRAGSSIQETASYVRTIMKRVQADGDDKDRREDAIRTERIVPTTFVAAVSANEHLKLAKYFEALFQELKSTIAYDKAAVNDATSRDWNLYVMKLSAECWYVGITTHPIDHRASKHDCGRIAGGACWPERHPALTIGGRSIEQDDLCIFGTSLGFCSRASAELIEDHATIAVITKFGLPRVRGGHFSHCSLQKMLGDLRNYQSRLCFSETIYSQPMLMPTAETRFRPDCYDCKSGEQQK